jgi:hypothetical protein
MTSAREHLEQLLETRVDQRTRDWLAGACAELRGGADDARFAALLSMASRFARPRPLAPTEAERARAAELVPGWNPERWRVLEALRVALVLAREGAAPATFARAYEEAFRFADEGECRALYRALALLPDGTRFAWRAGEGCRTNIVPVFEAVACDSPYPAAHFDDVAWNQMCMKAVFIGAPLWRVHGLDGRLGAELARMALDLADERRSAGRPVQPDLWLCLGAHGGERALASLAAELETGPSTGRRAAALALGRAGARARLADFAADASPEVAAAARAALGGACDQGAWSALDHRS